MGDTTTSNGNRMKILLVEDNKDFAKLVQVYLQRFDRDQFDVIWKENYAEAMAELGSNKSVDIILMDYFLPGQNGLDITKEIVEKKLNIPVVFLTVNKDIGLALEALKLGVDDYLVKEEISSPILPKTVLNVIEKHRLKVQLQEAEAGRQRLAAIHDTLAGMVRQFEEPLYQMREICTHLDEAFPQAGQKHYVEMIESNTNRIIEKLEKMKALKAHKTVKYIKDIKMLDLS